MQETIVYIIGLAAIVFITRRVLKLWQKPSSPCDGCSGCDLKDIEKGSNKPNQC